MLYAEICPKVRRHNARPGRGVKPCYNNKKKKMFDAANTII
jgi:hypothetical protein